MRPATPWTSVHSPILRPKKGRFYYLANRPFKCPGLFLAALRLAGPDDLEFYHRFGTLLAPWFVVPADGRIRFTAKLMERIRAIYQHAGAHVPEMGLRLGGFPSGACRKLAPLEGIESIDIARSELRHPPLQKARVVVAKRFLA